MANFFVLFDEKEGTSNLIQLLDHFSGMAIVHQVDNRGWEPFDWHLHRSLSIHSLMRCLDLVYAPGEDAAKRLNSIYTRTSDRALETYDKSGDIGFKMRLALLPGRHWLSDLVDRRGPAWLREYRADYRWYERRMMAMLRKHDVIVIFAVRQDLLRWALSKYHGDGTGTSGHLQFDIAAGRKSLSDVPAIEVDPDRLAAIIDNCRFVIDEKIRLMRKMQALGIGTGTAIYEEFLQDEYAFFHKLFAALGRTVSDEEIATVLEKGTIFKKVHSDDISEFVINHQEIEARFGDCVVDFEAEMLAETAA